MDHNIGRIISVAKEEEKIAINQEISVQPLRATQRQSAWGAATEAHQIDRRGSKLQTKQYLSCTVNCAEILTK